MHVEFSAVDDLDRFAAVVASQQLSPANFNSPDTCFPTVIG